MIHVGNIYLHLLYIILNQMYVMKYSLHGASEHGVLLFFGSFFGDLSPTIPSLATMKLDGGASPFVRLVEFLIDQTESGVPKNSKSWWSWMNDFCLFTFQKWEHQLFLSHIIHGCLVYWPIHEWVDLYAFHVGKYTSNHGWYGYIFTKLELSGLSPVSTRRFFADFPPNRIHEKKWSSWLVNLLPPNVPLPRSKALLRLINQVVSLI